MKTTKKTIVKTTAGNNAEDNRAPIGGIDMDTVKQLCRHHRRSLVMSTRTRSAYDTTSCLRFRNWVARKHLEPEEMAIGAIGTFCDEASDEHPEEEYVLDRFEVPNGLD